EAVEYAKRERRHGEEIHRCNGLAMVAQKRRPSFGLFRVSRRSPHPAQHGSLRNIEAEHLQFAVNARCSPCQVLRYHAENEVAQCPACRLPADATPFPRDPFPIQLETLPMPADNCFWP